MTLQADSDGRYADGQREATTCRHCGSPIWKIYHGANANHTVEPREPAAEREFLAASVAVWREIDKVLATGEMNSPDEADNSAWLSAAWERYRDLLDQEGRRVDA